MNDVAPATEQGIRPDHGVRRWVPLLVFAAVGVLLTIAFFPLFFNHIATFDDEGALAVAIRQFMKHGHLYGDTHGPYGPFYFSFEGLVFGITGTTPTLFTGRVLVIVLTTLSSGFFGAAVWRVTRSLLFGVLCEVLTYSLLMVVAGTESLHPGPLIVFLLSVMMYAVAGYATRPRTGHLVVVGAVLGALVMTKANIGIFAIAAVVVALVVGNPNYPKKLRVLVGVAALAVPFVVMYSLIYQASKAQLAILVSFSLLAAYVPWSIDEISVPPRALLVVGAAAVVTAAASAVWPLTNGSSPGSIFAGVFLRVDNQTRIHSNSIVPLNVQWLTVALTIAAAYFAYARYKDAKLAWLDVSWWPNAGFAVAGLLVLGQAMSPLRLASWLPAIAILPALALVSRAPPAVRLTLRVFVAIAILQILHVYPISGAQSWWGTVPAVVPCVIAVAVALARQRAWRRSSSWFRRALVAALGVMLVVGVGGRWPPSSWKTYNDEVALGLPGTRLVRLDAGVAANLQDLTHAIKQRCDTFYSAPAFHSLYIFTGISSPTGLLANSPGALSTSEQSKLASELADLSKRGERVCIVRDVGNQSGWKASSYGTGPLGKSLARYQSQVARVGRFSISVQGPGRAPTPVRPRGSAQAGQGS